MIKRMFGEVTPKTAAESEALYQRFMKLFDDPDNFFSAYVADARDLGYVQSHFGRLDYQIGFGNSWAEAYCSVLDGIEEKLLLDFESMPWQHNIDAVVSSYKALNEDSKDDQNEITSSKETAPSKKEQNKKGQGNQNKKFKWFR